MSKASPLKPAIEGWFTLHPERPALLGTRCAACESYFFPKETVYCHNPHCTSREFSEVELSRTGTVWSFTTNHYAPPAPYISPEPFRPYTIAAVELAKEKMVVLGQMVHGLSAADLQAGMEVELVLEPLYQQDGEDVVTWKWKPLLTP